MSVRIEYQPEGLTYEHFLPLEQDCFPHEPLSTEAFADAVTHDFWAAWDEDSLVGYAYLVRKPDVSWLSRLGTSTAYRRQGVGAALMNTVLGFCSEIGLPDTILYVKTDNSSAIRLYERFSFQPIDSTWQFLVREPWNRLRHEDAKGISAVPICDLPLSARPLLSREWSNLHEMHRPPESHVMVFRRADTTIGYFRLNPDFPGCFPFVIGEPEELLLPALASIRRILNPEKDVLKLTISDPDIAEACRTRGFELNYELVKMMRRGNQERRSA